MGSDGWKRLYICWTEGRGIGALEPLNRDCCCWKWKKKIFFNQKFWVYFICIPVVLRIFQISRNVEKINMDLIRINFTFKSNFICCTSLNCSCANCDNQAAFPKNVTQETLCSIWSFLHCNELPTLTTGAVYVEFPQKISNNFKQGNMAICNVNKNSKYGMYTKGIIQHYTIRKWRPSRLKTGNT